MSTVLEKLITRGLLFDKLTGQLKGVGKSMLRMQKQGCDGMKMISKEANDIFSTASAWNSMADPTRDMAKALGDVKSLGVGSVELGKLERASKDFAQQFGGDAAAIVRSAYDVQSTIPGLGKGALAAFAYQGALLAKATKADAGTITKYLDTMYSIFENDAKKIGQAKWIEILSGKTAEAVKIFKTTGPEMSAAFSALGSTGRIYGRSMSEQMAILGTLQGAMMGASAGTAYKAFLNNVSTAGQELGLNFFDAQRRMLPMVEILEKIQGKFGRGELSNANVAEIMSAFGEQGGKAVVNLLGKTDQLKKSIGQIAAVKGSSAALEMAMAMVDPLERFNGTLQVLEVTLGKSILPIVNVVLSTLATVFVWLELLLDKVPVLNWLLGISAVVVTVFGMAWRTVHIITGAINILRTLCGELRIVWAWCLKSSAATHLMTMAQRIQAVSAVALGKIIKFLRLQTILGTLAFWGEAAAVWSVNAALRTWNGACLVASGVSWLLTTGLWGACAAAWAFATALFANPVTWIVLGVVALIGVLVLLVKYWDEVCAFCLKYADILLYLLGPIGWVVIAFRHWDSIVAVLREVWDWFTALLSPVVTLLDKITGFSEALGAVGRTWDWLTGKTSAEVNVKGAATVPDAISARRPSRDVPPGGLANGRTTNNHVNYGGVTINTSAPVGPGMLEDMYALNGGIA